MLESGQFLTPRYKVVGPLGNGGMGALYEAFDTILEATVVIKENLIPDDSMRLAFKREAQLLANLHHPSLPTCFDLFTIDNTQYMVLEFINGDDLEKVMSTSKEPLATETVLGWAKQLLNVVEYLHAEMVLHRDIKPANIKISEGRLYLLDFGLAYGECGDMNTIARHEFNWECYSRKYSSPEQLRGERTQSASDLYSLAATLYRLLTYKPGTKPSRVDAEFRIQCLKSGKADPLIPIERADLDHEAAHTIMQSLSLQIAERPQSAFDMSQMMFPERLPQVTKVRPHIRFQFARIFMLIGILLAGVLIGVSASTSKQIPKCENQAVASPASVEVTATSLSKEAEALWLSGKYESALEKIKQALSRDDTNAYLHFIYGEVLWDLNELTTPVAEMSDVQAEAEQIIRLLPSVKTEEEKTARAWAFLVRAKTDKALDDANAVLIVNPDSAKALLIRTAARSTGMKVRNTNLSASIARELVADCDKAIKSTPNYPHAYAIRASILIGLKQLEAARDDLEHAVSLRQQASFLHLLGHIYLQLNELVKARDNEQFAIKQNPQYSLAYVGLGDVYFKKGDWNRAADNYLSANKIRRTANVFSKLGDTYLKANRIEAAVASYHEAVKLDPNDLNLKVKLGAARAALT